MSTSAGIYFTDPVCLEHDPRLYAPGHPEIPERLAAIEAALGGRDWLGLQRRPCPPATSQALELVHDPGYLRALEERCAAGGGLLDADTAVGERSYVAALHAAGGACAMTEALLGGEARLGFCAVRPPGHHAEADRAMGFCLFNNVAVAGALATERLGCERVLILDWDVHHGNGTAEAFRHSPSVLYVSIHQQGIYPGSGALADVGSLAGERYTINLPVPGGSGGDLWCSAIAHILCPVALEFAPQLILLSAGYDAHRRDPLAGCLLECSSFAEMAASVGELARTLGAPLGLVLEGGYEPVALGESVLGSLEALIEERRTAPLGLHPRVRAMRSELAQHWPVLADQAPISPRSSA
jgi:acetoin utilization deacetylase AcuC-like enzyme